MLKQERLPQSGAAWLHPSPEGEGSGAPIFAEREVGRRSRWGEAPTPPGFPRNAEKAPAEADAFVA